MFANELLVKAKVVVIVYLHIPDRINQCDQCAVDFDGSRRRGAKTTANSDTANNNQFRRTARCTC